MPDLERLDVERIRLRHRAMDIYSGEEYCLEDGACYYEQDYPIGEEPANGGFCPHTAKVATICPGCSRMDYKTETWPEADWVRWPCSTLAALDASSAPDSPAPARTDPPAGVEPSGGTAEAQEG